MISSKFFFRDKAQCKGALWIEVAGPALHNASDHGIGLAAHAFDCLAASNLFQGCKLLRHRAGNARKRDVAAAAQCLAVKPSGVDQMADGTARRDMPMAHVIADGENCFHAVQGFADDAGEEAGGGLVGFSRTDTDGWHADADTIEESAA